jgi:hypothetical protein
MFLQKMPTEDARPKSRLAILFPTWLESFQISARI